MAVGKLGDDGIKTELATISVILKSMDSKLSIIEADIKDIETKLNDTTEKTTRHDEKIIQIDERQKEVINNCKSCNDRIYEKIRLSKEETIRDSFNKVKLWLYGAIIFGLVGGGASVIEKIISVLK
jgi:chromosome segregation ATPase